jgi:trimeric autotransporter adhesin
MCNYYTLVGASLRSFQAVLIGLFFLYAASSASAQTIYALSGGNLVSFKANSPGVSLGSAAVSGVAAGQTLAGLDFRPNTGQLYALGYNNATGAAQLYTLNPSTGAATAVNAVPVALKAGMGKIGFDFNPTVDRIRVTGSDNSNYRLHPVTGALAATDGNLAFATGDPNAAKNPSVGAGAYTNSYIGAATTTLFNYDDSLNVFTTQNPPNNGVLNTVGASGIAVNLADPTSDFDIFFDNVAATNQAYFAANTTGQTNDNLYTVNLTTGATTLVGSIGVPVSDIAVLIERNVPATVTGQLVYALTSNNNLISFDSGLPGTVRTLVGVTGVAAGQNIVGMDFRPATGALFALGYNATNGESRIYTIDRMSGVATAVGTAPFTLALGTGDVGFDFNPTVDRIRVTGANNANLRLNPVTGTVAATDMNLAFAATDANAGKNPAVGASAYTNSFNTATTTTLYNYDDSLNVLATQIPPNNGTLNTVGATGIALNPADPSVDFDIYYNFKTATNLAYLAANTGTSNTDQFYTLNLATGAATPVGRIGFGIPVRDIAVFIDSLVSVGVTDLVQQNRHKLSVYPNPISDRAFINFELTESADVRLVVADLAGRQVETLAENKFAPGKQQLGWTLSNRGAGMYFVQLYLNNQLRGVAKVSVQR